MSSASDARPNFNATTTGKTEPKGIVAFIALLISIAIPVGVGFLGSQATIKNVDGWYATAEKAPWTPPNSVFSPVWIALYILMGLAVWMVWRRRADHAVGGALGIYVVQLILNGLWTPAFFGLFPEYGTTALWAAMAIMALLIVAVVATIISFAKVTRAASWLLVPYLLWLSYASTLNLYAALNN